MKQAKLLPTAQAIVHLSLSRLQRHWMFEAASLLVLAGSNNAHLSGE